MLFDAIFPSRDNLCLIWKNVVLSSFVRFTPKRSFLTKIVFEFGFYKNLIPLLHPTRNNTGVKLEKVGKSTTPPKKAHLTILLI